MFVCGSRSAAAASLVALLTSTSDVVASKSSSWKTLPSRALTRARRSLNLSSTFGSATSAPPYDRILSQPVFQVTTHWGSPYMIFERIGDDDPDKKTDDDSDPNAVQTRPVGLYFLDQEDALNLRDEMGQMEHMAKSDLRITASSLGKALRHSTILGQGLPTGQPIQPMTGDMKTASEGGSLRYKIVPPKRELFYAARCEGRERVGLFGTTREEDAQAMLQPEASVHGTNLMRRANKKEREAAEKLGKKTRGGKEEDPMRMANAHMEGHVGIPVFHCPEMKRKLPMAKRLIRGVGKGRSYETPLFFSYEDLEAGWTEMRNRTKNKNSIPEKPNVEVFNLFDVVTSMDKDQWRAKRRAELQRKADGILGYVPFAKTVLKKGGDAGTMKRKVTSGMESVTFVPASRNVQFKEQLSDKGNRKARLRPMKAW